jgi:MFS family permease
LSGLIPVHPKGCTPILATKGAALIDVLLIVGIVFAVLLADRVGRIRLQIFGFIGCAVGLLLAAVSLNVGGTLSTVLVFAGFMLFSFVTNIGPNAMTYLIAGEVLPISVRGVGAGFAASIGKIGAVLTAFLFPVLPKDIGTFLLLSILVGTSLLGALVTRLYAFETKGINLENVEEQGGRCLPEAEHRFSPCAKVARIDLRLTAASAVWRLIPGSGARPSGSRRGRRGSR